MIEHDAFHERDHAEDDSRSGSERLEHPNIWLIHIKMQAPIDV
jgi:hypothetical protein